MTLLVCSSHVDPAIGVHKKVSEIEYCNVLYVYILRYCVLYCLQYAPIFLIEYTWSLSLHIFSNILLPIIYLSILLNFTECRQSISQALSFLWCNNRLCCINYEYQIIGLPLGIRARTHIFSRIQKFLRIGVKKTKLLVINNSGWGGR